MRIQVNLVISSRIYREGIADYFKSSTDFVMGGLHSNAAQLLAKLSQLPADVVVVDSSVQQLLPLVQDIKQLYRPAKVVVMMVQFENQLLSDCIAAGVEGFVTCEDGLVQLSNCLQNVHAGRICYPAALLRLLLYHPALAENPATYYTGAASVLTGRQRDIMQLLEEGISNKEIARQLGIELATVKNHVHQILSRLKVKNRCEAAALCRRNVH